MQPTLERRLALIRRNAHFMLQTDYALDRAELDKVFQEIIDLVDGRAPELTMPHLNEQVNIPALLERVRTLETALRTIAHAGGEDYERMPEYWYIGAFDRGRRLALSVLAHPAPESANDDNR